jgi:glucokinase
MTSVLGVDVGGTKVAIGPVDRAGVELAPTLVEATRTEDRAGFLAGLESGLRHSLKVFDAFEPKAFGLACAGTIDSEHGLVVASPNLPLETVPLAALLEQALGLPVVLENDVNAAVRAEATVGAAEGLRDVVMVTLGTGVGGGLWLDGRVYRGAGGGAGELGHTIVRTGGLPCPCGSRGCFEVYASGRALVRYAAARAGDPAKDPCGELTALQEQGRLTGGAVTRLAAAGDKAALEAVDELAHWLGVGLVNLTNSFDPEMIVVGGGVSALGELLLGPAREIVRKLAIPPGRDRVRIATARLGNRAGLVGGALNAWERLGETNLPAGLGSAGSGSAD